MSLAIQGWFLRKHQKTIHKWKVMSENLATNFHKLLLLNLFCTKQHQAVNANISQRISNIPQVLLHFILYHLLIPTKGMYYPYLSIFLPQLTITLFSQNFHVSVHFWHIEWENSYIFISSNILPTALCEICFDEANIRSRYERIISTVWHLKDLHNSIRVMLYQ